LSSASESSESSHTLPRAELNPLLNPVLAENMGRWAEVYFTSPPERREEAVLELLRELEAGNAGRVPVASIPPPEPNRRTLTFPSSEEMEREAFQKLDVPIQAVMAPCGRCGHDNPVTHQFCGMCGFTLNESDPAGFRTESPYEHYAGEMESADRSAQYEPPREAAREPYGGGLREDDRREEAPSNPYDLSIFQGLRDRGISHYEHDEPSSPPYRYYIGAVLAIVLVALGYIAWRGGQASESSHLASPAPAPQAAENTPTSPAPIPAAPVAATANQPIPDEPVASASGGNPASASPRPETTANSAHAANQNPPPSSVATPVAAGGSQPPPTSGAEDLAMAQRYLSGGPGQARDPARAVKLLWVSMGKHNAQARLELADRFLRGDGVPKNCDQARVLLDTAVIQGTKGAGERLRNMQAFGCQ